MAAHDTVLLAGHVTLQVPFDDRQRELEERSVGLLHFERRLAGVDSPLVDRPLLVSRARRTGEHLALLRQVEHDVARVALSAVRTLHRERAGPFPGEGRGACRGTLAGALRPRLRGEYRNECSNYECNSSQNPF